MLDGYIFKLLNIALGLLFAVTGNFLPKVTKNKVMGLRTSWSLYNENTWNKSQRWGGLALVITGIALIISSLFIKGYFNMIALCVALIALIVLSVALSYKAYRQELAKEAEEKD